jgi:methionyl-tRNA formyltransferase
MGTPEFAVPSLQALLVKHEVLAVVTAPDKPAGRGHLLHSSPIKLFALERNIPVLQPKNLKSNKFLEKLKAFNADLFVVVAFRMLPKIIWSLPRFGTLNLHGSLLPKYRGAAPIQHAIMNGESTTGLTVFKLNSQIDTGDIIGQCETIIQDDETGGMLHDKLMDLGGSLLLDSIEKLESGNVTFIMQDDNTASFAPKLYRADCQINWDQNVHKVYNHIRALSPYPCAWFEYQSQSYKVYETLKVMQNPVEYPGTLIIKSSKLLVACLDGYIEILEIQPNGKRKMKIVEFLNGFKSKISD